MAAPRRSARAGVTEERHAGVADGVLATPAELPDVVATEHRNHEEPEQGQGPGDVHQPTLPNHRIESSAPIVSAAIPVPVNTAVSSRGSDRDTISRSIES